MTTFHFKKSLLNKQLRISNKSEKIFPSRIFCIILGTLFILSLFNFKCSKKTDDKVKTDFRVGLVFDAGGKDDKSFNSSAWAGASRAVKDFNITLKDVEPGDPSAIEPAIRALAEDGFDLIFGIGFASAPYIETVSADYPNLKFSIIDSESKGDNVCSVVFKEHEGAFIVGMIAGMSTKTGTIGIVGGMDVPLIRRFVMGYEAGANFVNPKIKILANYAGVTTTAWSDPTKGKELALSQYSRGADIIFAAAGATGLGVFDAAEELNKLVIGCDSNQNWIKPGLVLTSMLKMIDVAVYSIIGDALKDNFKPGKQIFGLNNNGVGYAIDNYNKNLLTDEIIKKVEQAKKDIISGKIKVPDYYETLR